MEGIAVPGRSKYTTDILQDRQFLPSAWENSELPQEHLSIFVLVAKRSAIRTKLYIATLLYYTNTGDYLSHVTKEIWNGR